MNEQDGKVVAIVSHLTLIGWFVALIMNQSNKTEIGRFYLRQNLALQLLLILATFLNIAILSWVFKSAIIAMIIISLLSALNNSLKPLPFVGDKFQEWFSMI